MIFQKIIRLKRRIKINEFFFILAVLVSLYLIKAIKSYKNKNWVVTLLLVLCGLFDVVLFLCAIFLED
jgi:hypothetical protein